jgi:hypothetical protein
MSVAGRRSSEGDEYQLAVALHFVVEMLRGGSDLRAVQVEAVAIPQATGRASTANASPLTVDDIVLTRNDEGRIYIQAKKNQPDHREWRLSDEALKPELLKASKQLQADTNGVVRFFSRSPFGEVEKVVEEAQRYPDWTAFAAGAPAGSKALFQKLAGCFAVEQSVAFPLVRRVQFGSPLSFEDWDAKNLGDLRTVCPKAEAARDIIERHICNHQTGLRDAKITLTREEVLAKLRERGIHILPRPEGAELLESFFQASTVGRAWPRTVGGVRLERQELAELNQYLEQGSSPILVTDRPGGGKTCLLLDFAEQVERRSDCVLLFIRGDHFPDIERETDLAARGLPDNIAARCSWLADDRKVVVILDSLDVLAVNAHADQYRSSEEWTSRMLEKGLARARPPSTR